MADDPKIISELDEVTVIAPSDMLLTERAANAGTAVITFANLAIAVAVAHDVLVDQLIADTANLALITAAHADRLAALEGGV